MGVFTLTIVRHGETTANKERVIQGQQDTELSEKGLLQAELTGLRLQQENFTHVFASDLKRALRTCEVILEKNTACQCPIFKDPRLRERKFGTFEGRTSADFQAATRKHHKSSKRHEEFPPGGETAKQLKARAKEFFQDLCAHLLKEVETEGVLVLPGSITKRRRHTGSLTSDVFPTVEPTSPDSGPITFVATSVDNLSPTTTITEGRHSSSGSASSTSGYESLATSSLEQLSESEPSKENVVAESTSDISPSQESSSSSIDEATPDMKPLDDNDIQPTIPPPQSLQYGCPNVSLSPIFEHRLSSISSISSGRNNSFDDGDLPLFLAEVLIVSHGGWIQQLIRYFEDELGCKIPGGKKHALQTSPNAGVSKFTITLESGCETPVLTCLSVHDIDHLMGHEVQPLKHRDEA